MEQDAHVRVRTMSQECLVNNLQGKKGNIQILLWALEILKGVEWILVEALFNRIEIAERHYLLLNYDRKKK